MFINGIAHYLPTQTLSNDHFLKSCGVTSQWIEDRSGILERRVLGKDENSHTIASKAVDLLLQELHEDKPPFDLIIGATYTPHDTGGYFSAFYSKQIRHLRCSYTYTFYGLFLFIKCDRSGGRLFCHKKMPTCYYCSQ